MREAWIASGKSYVQMRAIVTVVVSGFSWLTVVVAGFSRTTQQGG